MEAMALESLVASVWRLDGFLAVTRHPIRLKGGWADVDVVGIRSDGVVRVAECKARGPARRVYVGSKNFKWVQMGQHLSNLSRLWDQRPPWLPIQSDVKSVEFHLVGNIWFENPKAKRTAENSLASAVSDALPHRLKSRSSLVIKPSIELLFEALQKIRVQVVKEKIGKRYGDPLRDALRELVRYANPKPKKSRRIEERIRLTVRADLLRAVFDES